MKRALSRKNAWESLPSFARTVIGGGLRAVPPAYLLGSRFRSTLRFLRESERWSRDQALEYQVLELRRLCRTAQSSPYYAREFARVGFDAERISSLEDLRVLPTLDRALVGAHRDELCAVSRSSAHVDYTSTSGTSGPPLAFYIGADRSAHEYAYIVASWARAGFEVGMPLVMFGGRVVQPDARGLRHAHDPVLNRHYFSNFHMGDEDVARYFDRIRTIGPCFLHAYPSAATALARFARRTRTTTPENIRGIILESETIHRDQRQLIADTFGCRLFSCYGQTEKLVFAAECEHSPDYHVWPTYGCLELLDSRGAPVTGVGERGEIVATGFMNRVMPFLRYRTGDYATLAGFACARCGRDHLLLSDIRGGRRQEYLVGRDGTLVSWTALNLHDDTLARVQAFRFFQDTPGRAVLHVVPAADFQPEDVRRIERRFQAKLDETITLTCEVADALAPTPRGKGMYVDQQIPITSGDVDV